MIPIQLTLEGIYSYQKRQTINFEALTNGGLFGIFGAVASGKSTILEAISFALYGDSERIGGSSRNYTMMNLKSNRMYIEFDFLNFENKKYRAVREYKRNGKNFEKVTLSETTFYEWIDENWIPLAHTNAEHIIGLSASNFKRTVIIPQGKFKEFIELKGTERTNMMKDLFDLHQFELSNNVKSLYSTNEEKLNLLNGKLSGYEEVTKEIIKEKEQDYQAQKIVFENASAQYQKNYEAFELLKEQYVDFHSLQKEKEKLATEELRRKEIEEIEKSLNVYVSTFQQFDEILRKREQLKKKIATEQQNLKNEEEKQSVIQEKLTSINEKLTEITPFIDKIEEKKQEVVDLELIKKILTSKTLIEKGQERTNKGKQYVINLTNEYELCEKTINEIEIKIEEISQQLIDAKTLTEIEVWFSVNNTLVKQIIEKSNKKSEIEEKLAINNEEFRNLNYAKENWTETIEKQKEQLNKQLDIAINIKHELVVKQEIAQFANQIHDGAACPLCGSLEHPHVIELEDVSAQISKIQNEVDLHKQKEKTIEKLSKQLTRLQESRNSFEKMSADLQADLEQLKKEKEQHRDLFLWKEFSYSDEIAFIAKKKANEELSIQKEELEKQLKEKRVQWDNIHKKLTRYKEELFKIEEENRYNKKIISLNEQQIKLLNIADYAHQSSETIEQLKNKKNLLIKNQQEAYTTLEKQHNLLLQEISGLHGTQKIIKKLIEELKAEHKENNDNIDAQLVQSPFFTIEEVEQLLSNKRNVEEDRALIESFKIAYAELSQSVKKLEKKLEGKTFSEEIFEAEKKSFEEAEKRINTLREILATLTHDLKRLENQYKQKKELLNEKEQLESRKANISTLMQLFKASGFVNYVSSIYLKNLCSIANERFHRLTRNQLSLQINDKNEFEIVDYLNNGHTRSVKTLSGGQSFQVSLSLALALAENVQTLTKSEKNFFFIDEGFGTQDSESVNIVFETLRNLQKGNRIVGIISHVEELQERIPKSLFVKNDPEHGSLIQVVE